MSKKNRLLSNTVAREISEDELLSVLIDHYKKSNLRTSLLLGERESLLQVAQAIKGNEINWSLVEDGIADGWDALKNVVRDFLSD